MLINLECIDKIDRDRESKELLEDQKCFEWGGVIQEDLKSLKKIQYLILVKMTSFCRTR